MFNDVYGQTNVTTLLSCVVNSIEKDKNKSYAALMLGPSGSGKTKISKEFGEEVKNKYIFHHNIKESEVDIQIIDVAKNNGVDFVRSWSSALTHRAIRKVHIYIFDESHRFTAQAWDSMLLTLEDLPPMTYILFCTTSSKNIPETIISRLNQFVFNRLLFEDLLNILKDLKEESGIKFSKAIDYQIIVDANGNARELIKKFKTIVEHYSNTESYSIEDYNSIFKLLENDDIISGLFEALIAKDTELVSEVFESCRSKFNTISEFLDLFHIMIKSKIINHIDDEFYKDQIYRLVMKEFIVNKRESWDLLCSLFILDCYGMSYNE